MCIVKIDKEILKCAVNDLTINEIRPILELHELNADSKSKKHELIDMILNKAEKNELSEELYLALKTKAFSTSELFYEGFFYKYNIENIDIKPENFLSELKTIANSESQSKQSNVTFKYSFYNEEHITKDKLFKFTFFRESKKGVYDYKDDDVKFFYNKIQANIEIYYGIGIVYIHSKNLTESTAIKCLLQKGINKFLKNEDDSKIKLISPKFDNKIVEKWSKENNFNVNGISTSTIHMLDLLCEFDIESNNFTGFSIKRIYLEHEIIDTKENSKIAGLIFWGENLQDCNEILEEISSGKKIKGFDLEVQYIYEDIETGDENTSVIKISIIQEDNKSIRISLTDENNCKDNVLSSAYESIRRVFLNKMISNTLNNTEDLKSFINRCREAKDNQTKDKPKKTRKVY